MKTKEQTKNSKNNSQAEVREMGREKRARAAYARILSRLEQVDETALAPRTTNMSEAALASIGVAERVAEPALYARFQSIPATEFDIAHADDLGDLAWGTLHAAMEADKIRYVLSRSRLPEGLLDEATEVKNRMQASCEYLLAEDPTAGPEVERLRAGRGHRDLAADLHGYAALYEAHQALLEKDPKNYRPSDMDDALRLGEEIFSLVGGSLTEKERSASAQLVRAWTLLLQSYEEVRATGHYLLRHDKASAEMMFPSLFTIGRAPRSRRDDDAPVVDLPGLPDEPTAAPAQA
jgi:hypothetical protein